jgi:hypothetical protein
MYGQITKLLRASGHLYKSNRALFAASILEFLKINPILVFQLVVFLRWPGPASAAMVVAGAMIGHCILNISYMITLIAAKVVEKIGVCDTAGRCEFHPYSVRDFLGDEAYEDLDRNLVKRLTPFDFDKIVRIYRVYQPGVLRANLQCYAAPLFGADIFITDKPSETRGVQRLFVLHEIGHSLLRMASLDYATVLGVRPFLFFLLWASSSIQWDRGSAFVFAAYVSSMLAWREDWKRKAELVRLNDEIIADGFAFSHIDIKDIQRIAKCKSLPNLADPDMEPIHNLIRMANFRQYLQWALEGKVDDILGGAFKLLPKPRLMPLAAAVAGTSILGFYASAPSIATLGWSIGILVVLGIFTFVAVVLRSLATVMLDDLLRSRRLAEEGTLPQ